MTTVEVVFEARGGGSNIGAKMLVLTLSKLKKIFVFDCGTGMAHTNTKENVYLPKLEGLNPDYEIKVFATHGHQDHIGALAKLAVIYPKTKVFATAPTLGLVEVMGKDAIKIRTESRLPLHYTEENLNQLLDAAQAIRSTDWISVGDGCQVRFEPAGHIRGAATIILKTPYGTFMDSGDINFYDTTTVRGASKRLEDKVRWLAVDSTNGNDTLANPQEILKELLQDTLKTIKNGGNVLIPAFAIGRGPDVAIFLARELRKYSLPVWSGGLLRKVTESCHEHHWESDLPVSGEHYLNQDKNEIFGLQKENVRWINMRNMEKIAWGRRRVVVIPSGMLEAGYAQYFLAYWGDNPKNAVFLPGYQAEGTCGRKLLEYAEKNSDGRFSITSPTTHETVEINFIQAKVKQYRVSGHADGHQLAEWIGNMKPEDGQSLDAVITVHGDQEGHAGLHQRLMELPNRPKKILVGENQRAITLL